MANLVIPAVGATLGYIVGGPTGAQVGWVLGSAVATGRQEIRQDSIADLRIQTAAYGTAIPYIVGRQRVAGNIIWAAEKTKYDVKTKSGKGGPTTISTGYKISMLVGICAGPIIGVSRIWANGDLIVDATVEAKPLIGQLYLGNMSQTPDPTYESHVGDGNAPAYRGLAYISLNEYDLGVSGVVPNFTFEVIKGADL